MGTAAAGAVGAVSSEGLGIKAGLSTTHTKGPWLRTSHKGKDVFGADWHKFNLRKGGPTVNRPHLHFGKTKNQFKKHWPWQRKGK